MTAGLAVVVGFVVVVYLVGFVLYARDEVRARKRGER